MYHNSIDDRDDNPFYSLIDDEDNNFFMLLMIGMMVILIILSVIRKIWLTFKISTDHIEVDLLLQGPILKGVVDSLINIIPVLSLDLVALNFIRSCGFNNICSKLFDSKYNLILEQLKAFLSNKFDFKIAKSIAHFSRLTIL